MLRLRRATLADCEHLAPRARQADVEEVRASSGLTVLEALRVGLKHSAVCIALVDEQDNPLAIGGVTETEDPLCGAVWLLVGEDIRKHQIAFLRLSRRVLGQLHAKWPVLMNCVDERNALHIRWLRWLGFTFICRHPLYGVEWRPFIEFLRHQHV